MSNSKISEAFKKLSLEQKKILDLIPQKDRPRFYKGLKSHLHIAIDDYVDVMSESKIDEIKTSSKKTISGLTMEVDRLKKLLDDNKIKHTLTSEDVYPESHHIRD